jgi:hypothetical protein
LTVHAGRFRDGAAVLTGGWLASDEMGFSTGTVFDASGGRATY